MRVCVCCVFLFIFILSFLCFSFVNLSAAVLNEDSKRCLYIYYNIFTITCMVSSSIETNLCSRLYYAQYESETFMYKSSHLLLSFSHSLSLALSLSLSHSLSLSFSFSLSIRATKQYIYRGFRGQRTQSSIIIAIMRR